MLNPFLQQIFDHHNGSQTRLADKQLTHQFIDSLFDFLFIPKTGFNKKEADIEKGWLSLKSHLTSLIYDVVGDGAQSQQIAEQFFEELPQVYNLLQSDAQSFIDNDPAALNIEEVYQAYPGFFAIAVYRISHLLWNKNVKALARLFTEYAHSRTGIDIHPGATIGQSFFIDHGTGVVIGETALLGNNIKIYQGVTIGALNSAKNKKESRRHPVIEDNVIIYSGATILGGETLIGHDSVIGGNAWITFSVPPSSLVYHKSEVVAKEHFSHKNSVEEILKNH
ncbi:MAG: serine O-acetyltransferase EpsC [Niabella sp.]